MRINETAAEVLGLFLAARYSLKLKSKKFLKHSTWPRLHLHQLIYVIWCTIIPKQNIITPTFSWLCLTQCKASPEGAAERPVLLYKCVSHYYSCFSSSRKSNKLVCPLASLSFFFFRYTRRKAQRRLPGCSPLTPLPHETAWASKTASIIVLLSTPFSSLMYPHSHHLCHPQLP